MTDPASPESSNGGVVPAQTAPGAPEPDNGGVVAAQPPPQCRQCGRAPAATIHIRRHVGMLVVARMRNLKAPLCREHGEALVKQWLKSTLLLGWWGIIAFFLNFYAVGLDIVALRKVRKLGPPTGVPMAATTVWLPKN